MTNIVKESKEGESKKSVAYKNKPVISYFLLSEQIHSDKTLHST